MKYFTKAPLAGVAYYIITLQKNKTLSQCLKIEYMTFSLWCFYSFQYPASLPLS